MVGGCVGGVHMIGRLNASERGVMHIHGVLDVGINQNKHHSHAEKLG